MLPIIKRKGHLPSFVDEFFGNDILSNFFENRTGITMPAVNVIEGKDEFRIELAAPGLKKDDFKIDLNSNILSICSEKENKKEETEENYIRREFSYTSFNRAFTLPESANAEKVNASFNEGILTIQIPKKDEAREKQPREIKIS